MDHPSAVLAGQRLQPRVFDYGLRITDYGLRIRDYGLEIKDDRNLQSITYLRYAIRNLSFIIDNL